MNITPTLNGSWQPPPLSDPLVTTVTSVSVNMFFGPPLNGYIMWLILRGSRESITCDFFFLNLAISQFIFSLSCIWYMVFFYLKLTFCILIFVFSIGLLFLTNPLFQCCICIECFLGVVHPVFYLRFKPLRYKLACCCAAWVFSLASSLYYITTYSDPIFMYGNCTVSVLMFCITTFCCFSVLKALKRPKPGERDSGKKISNAKKRKAFRLILLIMISIAVNLLSYVISVPLQCCFDLTYFRQILEICLCLALTNAFMQPFLYLHKSRNLPCMRKD